MATAGSWGAAGAAFDRRSVLGAPPAFAPGRDDRFVASAPFTKLVPREAAKPPGSSLAPGLSCRLYEGDWKKLPDFSALKPARSLVVPTVALTPEMPKERFGLVCSGYLAVPGDGLTTFSLRAEDGAELLVDGESVVKNEPTEPQMSFHQATKPSMTSVIQPMKFAHISLI